MGVFVWWLIGSFIGAVAGFLYGSKGQRNFNIGDSIFSLLIGVAGAGAGGIVGGGLAMILSEFVVVGLK